MTVADLKEAIASGYLIRHINFLDVCFIPTLIVETTEPDLQVKGFWFNVSYGKLVTDSADYITIRKDLLENWRVLQRR